ncbi:hypothetical protein E4U54_006039 [Claviceps lovelessii]|nr:hypothetical protein E4U54_006039 [Claviceps lovelessii]
MRGGTSAQVGVDASQLKASLSSWTEAAGAKVKGFVDYGTGSSLDGRKARWCRLQRKRRDMGMWNAMFTWGGGDWCLGPEVQVSKWTWTDDR